MGEMLGHELRFTDRSKSLMNKRNTIRLEKCLNELAVENDNSEIKCGDLYLLQTVQKVTRRIPVYVRVYRTTFEHYAVFYQNRKFSKASTYINLKHCSVCGDTDFVNQIRITTDDAEGNVVVLETDTLPARGWLEAFQEKFPLSPKKGSLSPKLSPMIPRSPVMQTLHETDEEE